MNRTIRNVLVHLVTAVTERERDVVAHPHYRERKEKIARKRLCKGFNESVHAPEASQRSFDDISSLYSIAAAVDECPSYLRT
jgi:hypothetical protein